MPRSQGLSNYVIRSCVYPIYQIEMDEILGIISLMGMFHMRVCVCVCVCLEMYLVINYIPCIICWVYQQYFKLYLRKFCLEIV